MKAADRHQLSASCPSISRRIQVGRAYPEGRRNAVDGGRSGLGVLGLLLAGARHMIGLAFVKSGRERMGEKVVVWDKLRGQETEAVISSTVFFDPENKKLHA